MATLPTPSIPALHHAALAVASLALLITLSPALGGYGLIAWSWHPALLALGLLALTPLGLLSTSPASPLRGALGLSPRPLHGALLAGATLLILAGYLAAWYIHHAASHNHFPRAGKPLVYYFHVYGGLLVLAGFAAQALGGAARLRGAGGACARLLRVHPVAGGALWAGGVAVLLAGFSIPMVVKGGAPWLFALLAACCGALVWGVLRAGAAMAQ